MKRRNYAWWFAGDTAMDLGSGIQAIAIPLLALAISGSPAVAGAVGMAQGIGSLVSTLPGGVLADRADRRRIVAVGSSVIALVSAVLAGAALLGVLGSWVLAAGLAAMGLGAGLVGPANNALLRSVVERSRLGPAVSINQGRDAAVGLASGPLGGALFALAPWLPLLCNAIAAALRSLTVLRIERSVAIVQRTEPAPPWINDLASGFRFVFRAPVLRSLALIATAINFAGGGIMVALVLSLRLDGADPAAIGLLYSTMAAGVLVGAPLAAWLIARVPTGLVLIGGFALEFAGLLGTAFAPSLQSILVLVGVVFVAMPAINAAAAGYLMAVIPLEMQGRAGAAIGLLSLGAAPLGTLLAGVGLEIGTRQSTIASFAAVFALTLLAAVALPYLRRIPRPSEWPDLADAREEGSDVDA